MKIEKAGSLLKKANVRMPGSSRLALLIGDVGPSYLALCLPSLVSIATVLVATALWCGLAPVPVVPVIGGLALLGMVVSHAAPVQRHGCTNVVVLLALVVVCVVLSAGVAGVAGSALWIALCGLSLLAVVRFVRLQRQLRRQAQSMSRYINELSDDELLILLDPHVADLAARWLDGAIVVTGALEDAIHLGALDLALRRR